VRLWIVRGLLEKLDRFGHSFCFCCFPGRNPARHNGTNFTCFTYPKEGHFIAKFLRRT
jgi:hypothetical protein